MTYMPFLYFSDLKWCVLIKVITLDHDKKPSKESRQYTQSLRTDLSNTPCEHMKHNVLYTFATFNLNVRRHVNQFKTMTWRSLT